MNTWLPYAFFFFAWIGFVEVVFGAITYAARLSRIANTWSDRRAKIKVLQAICDYELGRGVQMYAALDYAVGFALPGYVRAEWRDKGGAASCLLAA